MEPLIRIKFCKVKSNGKLKGNHADMENSVLYTVNYI